MTNWVLGHLNQYLIAGLQSIFYLAGAPMQLGLAPIDFTGVEHAISALSDIYEGRLHRRQDVLDAS